jgi:hypothetical protein
MRSEDCNRITYFDYCGIKVIAVRPNKSLGSEASLTPRLF